MRANLIYLPLVLINTYFVVGNDCPWGWSTSRTNPSWPCYLVTNKIQRAWSDAQTFCTQMGGSLWKIDTLEEKNWMYKLLKVYHGYYPSHTEWWIGLHDNPGQTGVMWVDKSQPNMQLLQWVPGEPQTYDRSKACVQYYNGSMRHDDCQQEKYFICERSRSSAVFCDARHGWESIGSTCYKTITKLRTWDDARGECQKENGDLMIVKDSGTEMVLYNFIESRRTDMWFGLRAFQSSSGQYSYKWQTKQGTTLSDVNAFWSQNYVHTTSAMQAVTSSSGNLSCVIANHTVAKASHQNFWEPANCGVRAFSLCQKAMGRCTSGWLSHRGNCYQVVNRYKTSWTNANNYCKQQGANLLTIPYSSSQIYVSQTLHGLKSQGINSVWIGLSDTNQDGTWQWSDGTRISSFGYTNYGGSQPMNRLNTPDCFHIFTDDANSTWQIATNCNVNNSFICQIQQGQTPKVPTPPPGVTDAPFTTPVPVTWSSDCGPMWVKDSTSGFCYKFTDKTLTWNQAQADCQSQGAQLTSINNYHEERFIADRLYGYTSPALWIGMNDLNSHQGYHWIDGSGFGFFNWAPGEPNNAGNNERCGEIISGGIKISMWNDIPCDQQRSYICKKKSSGEPNNGNNNEHCAEIIPRGANRMKWNDVNCGQTRGYICKKKSTDFPTTLAPVPPSVPAGQTYGCPGSIWSPYKNNCFLFMKTATSWSNARTFCHTQGAELASIADENEQNFVFSQIPRITGYRDQFWLGLNDMDIQMKFEWTDNSSVTYTNWAEHEPNNYQNRPEDCVTVFQRDGMWNDETCENPVQGFVCKAPKSIMSSSIPQPDVGQGCSTPGYVEFGYNCYKLMQTRASWSDAKAGCSNAGATLAVITDKYQQAFLASQISGMSGFYWIGLTNSGTPYKWVDNSNLAYTAWSSNHTGNEVNTCVAMRSQGPGVGLWVNAPCVAIMKYICETTRSGFSTPLILTTTTTAPPTCPSNWHDYNGYCYKAYNSNSDAKTYFDARNACQGMGADLLSIHSSAEESYAFSYRVRGYSYLMNSYWIGLNDFDVEKGYKWSDGTAFNYTNWGTGEPNDSAGTDDCVEYNTGGSYWNDNTCYIAKPYICKIKKGEALRVTQAPKAPTAAPQCGSSLDWKLFNGSCYYVSVPKNGPSSRLSWFEARDKCAHFGADLASVHSVQEAGFISSLISSTVKTNSWIGLNDLGVDQFGWTDGTPFDFIHWNGGEPNDAFGSEKCGQVQSSNGYWNDNDCNEKYHFICKRAQGAYTTAIPTTIQPPKGGCPPGYTAVAGGGRCYKLFAARDQAKRLNYTEATTACRAYGKTFDLAGINRYIETATLVNMVNGVLLDDSDVWIGISDLNNNQRFTWQDSSRLAFTNWDKSEPQRSSGNCVVMATDSRHAGKWRNIACANTKPYICETRQDPSIQVATQPSMCTLPGYLENSMDCYKLRTDLKSWRDAEAACNAEGTHLVSVLTVYEQAFIDTLSVGLNSPIWIGMSDLTASGTYTWADSNRVIYSSWGKNEPTFTSGGDGRCISSYTGYWNDTQCSTPYPFICKKPFFVPPTVTAIPSGYCKISTWKQFDRFCYYINLNGALTYSQAEDDCRRKGMQLTSVNSRPEEMFLLQQIDSDPADSADIWIGFRKKGGFFSWADGMTPVYMNWLSAPTGNDCVMMRYADGKWQDSSCSTRKGYICKTPKLPATSPPPSTASTTTLSTTTTTTTTTTPAPAQRSSPTAYKPPVQPVSSSPFVPNPPIFQTTKSAATGRPGKQGDSAAPHSIPKPGYQQQQQKGSSSDLNAGQVTGIVVGVFAVMIVICAGLIVYRKRSGHVNISFKSFTDGGNSGIENAAYEKGFDKVSINGTNGSVKYVNGNGHSNGDSIGCTDA